MARAQGVYRFSPSCGRAALLPLLIALNIGVALPARAQDAADLLIRMDRLENENRRLNGAVEELRFQNHRLEDQLKRVQMDTDSRFRDLETGRGGNAARPSAPPPAGTPRPFTPPGDSKNTQEPSRNDAGRADPTRLEPADAARNPAPLPAAGGTPQSDFAHARALLERQEYEASGEAFADFMRKYPKDPRIAEATFWLGETYLRRTRNREAAEQFLVVSSKYSTSAKAPEAMLKLGIALRGLGATIEACETFEQVGKKYPTAAESIKAAVLREKTRAKC